MFGWNFGKFLPEFIDNFMEKQKASIAIKDYKREKQKRVDEIINYYHATGKFSHEIEYLRKFGADTFAYNWSKSKNIWSVRCGGKFNVPNRERYVVYKGKRLYMSILGYIQLLLEQHKDSPHAYYSDNFKLEKGDCFVDVGAAEGMMGLDAIEKASKVILIECSKYWISKMRLTFSNYSDKAVIVSKYVSDKNDDENITLDSILKNISAPILLKIDVEGMEEQVLRGASEVLKRPNTKVAICTYHRPEDADKFKVFFENLGYKTEISSGYMTILGDHDNPPYFRKAMLRAFH